MLVVYFFFTRVGGSPIGYSSKASWVRYIKKILFCIIKTPDDSFYHFVQAGAMTKMYLTHIMYMHRQLYVLYHIPKGGSGEIPMLCRRASVSLLFLSRSESSDTFSVLWSISDCSTEQIFTDDEMINGNYIQQKQHLPLSSFSLPPFFSSPLESGLSAAFCAQAQLSGHFYQPSSCCSIYV